MADSIEVERARIERRRGLSPDEWRDFCARRRQLFRAAMAIGGFTVTAFAERLDRQRVHVYKVLNGDRGSPWIEAAIYQVIAAAFPAEAAPYYVAPPPIRED